MPKDEWYVGSKMLMVNQLVDPIRTQSWIYIFMRWNFLGEKLELAANIIAESIYAQCDASRNEYLLLEAFVDHRNKGSALSVKEQRIVVKG